MSASPFSLSFSLTLSFAHTFTPVYTQMDTGVDEYVTAEKWLRQRIGQVPKTAIGMLTNKLLCRMSFSSPIWVTGWFRAGVGFYNKRQFELAIDCFQESVRIDPLNVQLFLVLFCHLFGVLVC
jgi:hypothetical protein